MGRADEAHRRTPRARRDRARRQVRQAAGRLSLRARGAQARRAANGCAIRVRWVDAEKCRTRRPRSCSSTVDGVLVPGGFGSRGWEGKILACQRRARTQDPVPRHLPRHARGGLRVRAARGRARRRQLDGDGSRDAVRRDDLLPEQKGVEDLGGTMRLGAQAVEVDGRLACARALRRSRDLRAPPAPLRGEQPLPASSSWTPASSQPGSFEQGRLVEIVELPDHPWFVASQFHPEFKSRPTRPAPLFQGFVGAALDRARSRAERSVAATAS